MEDEIVWVLPPFSCWGVIAERGAFISWIDIPGEGRVAIENDEFEEWSERAIDFESDDTGG